VSDTVSIAFLDAFADAWNRHDSAAIVAMMQPDAVMCFSVGPDRDGARAEGRAAIQAAADAFFARLPDARWNGARHFVAGDRGVSEWTFTATMPDGTRLEANGCDVFHFKDGLIAVKDSYRKSRR
jgi:ketosteroid isomerase-like protein